MGQRILAMDRIMAFLFSLLIVFPASLSGLQGTQTPSETTTKPLWEQRLDQRHQSLIQENGPGTDASLRSELLKMRETDQDARGFHNGVAPKEKPQLAMSKNLAEIDRTLTVQLRQIVALKGWPTISLVGIDASGAAMLILIHSPDHAWQRSLLPELELMAKANKIEGSGIALVIDKDLVASGKLQRYGSQFNITGDKMAMYAVEDPANLDQRRAEMMLPPMDAYKKIMADVYHLSVSEQVVSATPEALPEKSKP